MSVRRIISFAFMALVCVSTACGHPAAQHPIEVQVLYPQPASHCDNQQAISSTDVQLLVPHIRQSYTSQPDKEHVVLWGAGIAMISSYLGKPLKPCEIVSLRKGIGLNCCFASTDQLLRDCEHAATSGEISQVLQAIDLHFMYLPRPLSDREIQTEISNGRPILLARENAKMGRQILVIAGFIRKKDRAIYHVLDPAHTSPAAYNMEYAELVHGKNGKAWWHESWYAIAFRPDACNPRFHNNCECAR